MKSVQRVSNKTKLPDNYELHKKIDLKDNKNIFFSIQASFLLIAGLMIGIMYIFNFPIKNNWQQYIKIIVPIAVSFVYLALHEITHGVFARLLSKAKTKYFVRFPFLCTGCEGYFNKTSFIIVSLAPAIVWGIILFVLLFTLPKSFFLVIYILLIINFAGSSGDYVQAIIFSRLPSSALINDDGNETKVFLPIAKE